ncbi:unnamed protein product [Caenorhabditis nigoni]
MYDDPVERKFSVPPPREFKFSPYIPRITTDVKRPPIEPLGEMQKSEFDKLGNALAEVSNFVFLSCLVF